MKIFIATKNQKKLSELERILVPMGFKVLSQKDFVEQFEETKARLFSQTEEKPKINIIAYQSELVTPLQNGTLRANLICYRFDFAKNKLFSKKTLLNYGKSVDK